MPNKDGTGPNGQGSKTGRGAGKCGEDIDNISTEEESSETTFGKRDGSGCQKGRRCCGR